MEDVDENTLAAANLSLSLFFCPGKMVISIFFFYNFIVAALQGLPLANYSLPLCHFLSGEAELHFIYLWSKSLSEDDGRHSLGVNWKLLSVLENTQIRGGVIKNNCMTLKNV